MRFIDYIVSKQIVDDLPSFRIELLYKDEFTNDYYVLQSKSNEKNGTKKILFEIYKNDKYIGEAYLLNRDFDKMFNSFFDDIKDIDFQEMFYKEINLKLKKEINDFFKFYDEAIILNGITIEGELKRMKKIAGI